MLCGERPHAASITLCAKSCYNKKTAAATTDSTLKPIKIKQRNYKATALGTAIQQDPIPILHNSLKAHMYTHLGKPTPAQRNRMLKIQYIKQALKRAVGAIRSIHIPEKHYARVLQMRSTQVWPMPTP